MTIHNRYILLLNTNDARFVLYIDIISFRLPIISNRY